MVRTLVGSGATGTGEDVGKLAEGENVERGSEQGKTNALEVEQQKVSNGDEAKAEVAAEVADSAQKLDG